MKAKKFVATIQCPISKQVFIGDMCYALNDDIYSEVWGSMDYQDGVVEDEHDTYGIVVGTAHGDGCYRSNNGKLYCVDAGVLGVTNMDYIKDDECTYLGKIIDVPYGVCKCAVTYENGVIRIEIYTIKGNKIISEEIDTNF